MLHAAGESHARQGLEALVDLAAGPDNEFPASLTAGATGLAPPITLQGYTAVVFSQAYAADADGDGVCDAKDDCMLKATRLVADLDGDGYGNACDAKFPGVPGALVGAGDLVQFRASNGRDRATDTCGTTGTRPCAIFDLDEAAAVIGAGDLARFRALNGKLPGPKCATCPLSCTEGAEGTCGATP